MPDKIVATNRKVIRDYEVLESLEAGIVLDGSEVKSLRDGVASLRDSFAFIKKGEVFLINAHVSPYKHNTTTNPDPLRRRKLLLHKAQIRRLDRQVLSKGLTLVPLRLYFKRGIAKVELALVRGKRQYDKREAIAKRDAERDMRRTRKQPGLSSARAPRGRRNP